MPSIDFFDHIGGLSQKKSPFQYLKNETPDARHIEYDSELGGFSKATQYQLFNDDIGSTKIQGLFPFEQPSGGKKLLMATNGEIYESIGNAWSILRTGFDISAKYESAVLYNRLFHVNGADNMQSTTDAITWTATTQVSKYVEAYRNRLYLANFGTANANRFKWSDLGAGTTFSSTNFSDDITDPIVGLRTAYNFIYLFTEKAFYRFDEAYLVKVDDIGSTSQRSIVTGNGLMFWANAEGVWATNGVSKPQLISRPVQRWWDGINKDNLDDLNAAFWNNEYYLWIGTSQEVTDVVLIYNTLYKNWRVVDGWPSAMMITWTNPTNDKRLYFGNNTTDSKVYLVGGTLQQAGTTITARYTYPVITPAGTDRDFWGTILHTFAKSSSTPTFQIQYALDWNDSFTTLYEWTLEGKGFTEYTKIDVPRSINGRAIQFRILEQTAGIDWDWEGIKFDYEVYQGKET